MPRPGKRMQARDQDKTSTTGRFSFMSQILLSQLHGSRVKVDLPLNGGLQSLVGLASYENDEELGNVLRVCIADPLGDFFFVMAETVYRGLIDPGASNDWDYRIVLGDSSSANRPLPLGQCPL